ncbi:MAG: hypothetical protein KME46_05850 [Brasilonema angustatum HA4187-MV1]|jgi:hypothetical protein|nr:hypothetical protein [Brasilonema angustatum HA4187-MV1]
MQNQLGFVFKVFILSAGLSGLIKYILPNLYIRATATNALVIVFLPTVILTSVFLWRLQRQQN